MIPPTPPKSYRGRPPLGGGGDTQQQKVPNSEKIQIKPKMQRNQSNQEIIPLRGQEDGLRLRVDQNPVDMALNQQRQRNRSGFNARSNSENRYDGYERKYGIQAHENIKNNIAMNSPQNIRNNASKENLELQRSN